MLVCSLTFEGENEKEAREARAGGGRIGFQPWQLLRFMGFDFQSSPRCSLKPIGGPEAARGTDRPRDKQFGKPRK